MCRGGRIFYTRQHGFFLLRGEFGADKERCSARTIKLMYDMENLHHDKLKYIDPMRIEEKKNQK